MQLYNGEVPILHKTLCYFEIADRHFKFMQSFTSIALNSRNYKIIGLHKISHSIIQSQSLPEKVLEMHYTCRNNTAPWVNKIENQIF